jgi:hypothetical protein
MTFNLTINVTARDVTDATIGVGRVGLNAALQVSQTPVKVSETIMSMLIGPPLTIPNLVVLRLAIFVEAADYTAERAIISFETVRARGRPPIRTSCRAAQKPTLRLSRGSA